MTLSNGDAVTLNEANKWTATIKNLPKYAAGEEIAYTWTEASLPEGYKLTEHEPNGTITTLTNSHTPETIDVTVTKVWDDANNQDGKRPQSLTVTLSNGDRKTLNDENNWTATVEDLPKYADGRRSPTPGPRTNAAEGYELTEHQRERHDTTLTNTHTPETTEATVKKVWDDANNQDGKRPAELKVTLSNGTEVTLNDENEWTATVTDLPKFADGKEITYTWTEGDAAGGYTLTDTRSDGTITTLTNSYTPETLSNGTGHAERGRTSGQRRSRPARSTRTARRSTYTWTEDEAAGRATS